MTRSTEPGYVRIGIYDDAERRSLWARCTDEAIELCAGREGDDDYVKVDRSNPAFAQLRDVIECACFARRQLVDALSCRAAKAGLRTVETMPVPLDLRRDIERSIACGSSPKHEHDDNDVCPFDPSTQGTTT